LDNRENPSPAVQRRRLRAELRRARLNAGLTQEAVAAAMDWSLTELIRIELGLVGISANDLKALAQHYSVTDEERVAELLALSRAAREQSWWSSHRGISRPLGMLIEYENAAYLSRHYQDLVIPGLLQTTDYMRASTRQLAPDLPAGQVDTVIEVRLKRQELLSRPNAPLMFFVLDEAVIRRNVGGNDVMRHQMQQLVAAADMPNVEVEVVPFAAGLVPGLQAPFVIHEFSDVSNDDVLYLESPRGDLLSRGDADEILSYREVFERMRRASLGPDRTVDFLRTVIAELG
jgi:transcriptional regulator with XRE-family HTH domain